MAPRGWIAVHRDLANSMLVGHGALELEVPAPHVVGLLVNFWSRLHEADRHGCIETVPDTLLDQWAGWSGRPLAFARFLRKHHVDAAGKVKGWDEWQSGEAHAKQQHALRQSRYRARDAKVTAKRHAGDADVTTNGRTHSRTHALTDQGVVPPPILNVGTAETATATAAPPTAVSAPDDWRARRDREAHDKDVIADLKRIIAAESKGGGPPQLPPDLYGRLTDEQRDVLKRHRGFPGVWEAP